VIPKRGMALLAVLGAWTARPAAAQQPVTVRGQVTSTEGTPIAGASVVMPSLGLSAISRQDGQYVILVPANRAGGVGVVIAARAISYKPVSAQVDLTQPDVVRNFSLAANPLQLGEIVATGAGTTSELEKIGNVRNNVDSTQLQRSNEASVVNALSAKAPNVEVTSMSGDPGASASIRIRGVNTLSGTSQPLFVIDGIPVDNSVNTTASLDPQTGGPQGGVSSPNAVADLNPDDIESVEILKGAAAGAIYGARAGQGVILITTKRGQAGSTQYSLRTSLELSNVTQLPALQRKYGQGDGGLPDPCAQSNTLDCYATEDSWGPLLAPGTKTYDHAGELYQTGVGTDNELTISGGNDRTTFYVSTGLLNQNGELPGPNNSFNRKSVRLKADHRISNTVKVGGNVFYSNSQQYAAQKGFNFSGITWGEWRTPPEFNTFSDVTSTSDQVQRSFRFPNPSFGNTDSTRGYDNPLWSADNALSSSIAGRTIGDVTLDYTPRAWLKVNETLGLDESQDSRVQGQPPSSSNTPDPRGQVIKQTLVNTQIDHNLVATANFTLSQNGSGTFTLGNNINTRSYRQQGDVGNGLPDGAPFNLTNASTFYNPIDNETKVRIVGFFGQSTLDLWRQLYLKAGLRYDGASAYVENDPSASHLWAWFPSASAAWQFTNALGDLGGRISYGKLRLAYGEVGTLPSPYLGLKVYRAGLFQDFDAFGMNSGQGGLTGLFTPTTKPSTSLQPERTKELEMGTDVAVFGDKADLSFTWYRRFSSNVILPITVPASTGYTLEGINGAQIRNSGTEWAINIRPITKRDFSWDIGVVLGTNRNRVFSLHGAEFVAFGGLGGAIQGGPTAVAQVGLPLGVFRDYDYVRCGRGVMLDGGTYSVDATCTPSQIKSHALWLDDGTHVNANGLGSDGLGTPLLDPTQRVVGDPNPKWTGSIRTGIRWGHWSFSGLLDIRHGGVVWNGTRAALNAVGASRETELRGTQVVFGKNYMQGPVAGPGAGQTVTLDQNWFQFYDSWSFSSTIGTPFYEDGSFVKLREVSVGYTWDGGFVTKTLGLSSVELRVAGRNLITWTKYTGVDPETNLTGSETVAGGIDFFNNPQSRSFVFTATLNR